LSATFAYVRDIMGLFEVAERDALKDRHKPEFWRESSMISIDSQYPVKDFENPKNWRAQAKVKDLMSELRQLKT
jgi:hypothetical protein